MILLVKKKLFVGCLSLCMLMLLIYFGYIFRERRKSVLSDIRSLCNEVIHQDKENRLLETGSQSFSIGR